MNYAEIIKTILDYHPDNSNIFPELHPDLMPLIKETYHENWQTVIADILNYLDIEAVERDTKSDKVKIQFKADATINVKSIWDKSPSKLPPLTYEGMPTAIKEIVNRKVDGTHLTTVVKDSLAPLHKAGLRPWSEVIDELEKTGEVSQCHAIPDLQACLMFDFVYSVLAKSSASGKTLLGDNVRMATIDIMKEMLPEFNLFINDAEVKALLQALSCSKGQPLYHKLGRSFEEIAGLQFENSKFLSLKDFEISANRFIGDNFIFEPDYYWDKEETANTIQILDNYCQMFEYTLTAAQDNNMNSIFKANKIYYKASRTRRNVMNADTDLTLLPLFGQMPFLYLGKWIIKYLDEKSLQRPVVALYSYEHGTKGVGYINTTTFKKMAYCNLTSDIIGYSVFNPKDIYRKAPNGIPNHKERCILTSIYFSYVCACIRMYRKKHNLLSEKYDTQLFRSEKLIQPIVPQQLPITDLDARLAENENEVEQIKVEIKPPEACEFKPFMQELFRVEYLLRHSILFETYHYDLLFRLYKEKLQIDIHDLDIKDLPEPSLYNTSLALYLLETKQKLSLKEVSREFEKYKVYICNPLQESDYEVTYENLTNFIQNAHTLSNYKFIPGTHLLDFISEKIESIGSADLNDKTAWKDFFKLLDKYRDYTS